MRQHKPSQGFSLIELLIVMVIASILAMIAVPSYQASVIKSRRADGRVAMNDMAQRLERCYTQFGSYNGAGCAIATGVAVNSPEGYYAITPNIPNASTYTLTAAPTGAQSDDTACGNLSVTSTGVHSADGDEPDRCW